LTVEGDLPLLVFFLLLAPPGLSLGPIQCVFGLLDLVQLALVVLDLASVDPHLGVALLSVEGSVFAQSLLVVAHS
jgi:hypothetical protein